MIIYKITNNNNGKIYIGQTVSKLNVRWSQHVNYAIKRKGNSVLSEAIRKHGRENFTVEILEACNNVEEMNQKEISYIKDLNSLSPNGYNLDSGGKNKVMHQSTKDKLSKIRLGKKVGPFTLEHRMAISNSLKIAGIRPILTQEQIDLRAKKQTGEGNGMFGNKHSEESKNKMSLNKKGKKKGSENPFFGKKHSEETKQKIRQARLSSKDR